MNQVETKCGDVVSDYYDDNETINVWDDHIMALNVGIPAVDIIDIKYGENATAFGGHWHTHNDTDDKVSAESLQTVGRIVENGLVEGLFLDVRIDETTEDGQEPTNATQELEVDEETESSDQDIIGAIMMAVSVLIFGILVWTTSRINKGRGEIAHDFRCIDRRYLPWQQIRKVALLLLGVGCNPN